MKVSYIIWFIIVLLFSMLQASWPDWLRVQNVMPDLGLILVIYFALFYGEERAMYTGVLTGLYQDTSSSSVLGHHVLCLVVTGYIFGRLSSRLISEHPAIKAGLVFLGALLHGTLYNFVHYLQSPYTNVLYVFFTNAVPSAFYSAVLTPLVFWILQTIFKWVEPAPVELVNR